MRRALAVGAVLVLAALPAGAQAAELGVNVQFAEFGPGELDALPGDTVTWLNVSDRRHTVTADDDSFDSGDLFGGERFTRTFPQAGVVLYHCTVHAGMTGEIDVSPVTLGVLPTAAVPAGQPVPFDGRTAAPAEPVRIEQEATPGNWRTVATATPGADGSWAAEVRPERTGNFRAATSAGSSRERRLLVTDRSITVSLRGRRLDVSVRPALPYGRIALQLDLRDRFGWWPQTRRKLDYLSAAHFRLVPRARARVVLLDADGWTALATSRIVVAPA